MSDTPISFSANNNGSLTVLSGTTDSDGRAEARLSAGSDATNRTITVEATAGSTSESIDVPVTGTAIEITGPESIALGDTVTYSARLTNSDDAGIQGIPLNFNSDLGNTLTSSNGTMDTDSTGLVEVNLTADSGGSETLSVSSFGGAAEVQAELPVQISTDVFRFESPDSGTEIEIGTNQTVEVLWSADGSPIADGSEIQFSTTRGSMTPANGLVTTTNGRAQLQISSTNVGKAIVSATGANGGPSSQRTVEFVSTTPDNITVQSERTQLSTNSSTTITATVRDANNNLVKNATVIFSLDDITGGELSSGQSVTNSQGRAQTTYSSSSTTSQKDGVTITATVDGTINDAVGLTVGGNALRINIGTGNEIDDTNVTTYRAPWTVFVTDSNGTAVEDAAVDISVIATHFYKGTYIDTVTGDPQFQVSYEDQCVSEDANNNGIEDPGEDINDNGRLDPVPSATVPGSVLTGADGTADFTLTYPKSECSWVAVDLIATTRVGGTESRISQNFILACTNSDLNEAPPGGSRSPYGAEAGCNTDN